MIIILVAVVNVVDDDLQYDVLQLLLLCLQEVEVASLMHYHRQQQLEATSSLSYQYVDSSSFVAYQPYHVVVDKEYVVVGVVVYHSAGSMLLVHYHRPSSSTDVALVEVVVEVIVVFVVRI